MKKKRRGTWWMILGVGFFAAAIGLSAFNIWDSHRAEQSVGEIVEQMKTELPIEGAEDGQNTKKTDVSSDFEMDAAGSEISQEIEIPDYILNPDMEMPEIEIDGRAYIGVLEIPALELSLPVISEWSYPALRIAPCRYEGSAYNGHLIISAHNYESHFGNLKYLDEGDLVLLTDVDGNEFQYEVATRETIMPTDIEGMTGGDWDLTMFTCTYGGQQRVAVRCERILEDTFTY